jgi:hypothetical protein
VQVRYLLERCGTIICTQRTTTEQYHEHTNPVTRLRRLHCRRDRHVRAGRVSFLGQLQIEWVERRESSSMNAIVRARPSMDRRLYLGASIVFFALVFWTFARTFYLQPLFGTPPLSLLLHIHGVVMTGWVVLLVFQTGLIAAHRVRWHRRLGVLGAMWAALVVLFGSITTLLAAAREVRGHTDFAAGQVVITSLDLLQMLFFAGFVAIAIRQRHRIDYHKRLMLLTIACMLPDALARLPVSFMTNQLILVGMDGFIIICR